MSDPFADAVAKHAGTDLPVAEQVALGKPQKSALSDDHEEFIKTVIGLIDAGTIDTGNPMSFINEPVYNGLDPELKGKTDQAIPNIALYLDKIMDLHRRAEPNDSFEMKNLIDSLWLAKERIEEHADVFIF